MAEPARDVPFAPADGAAARELLALYDRLLAAGAGDAPPEQAARVALAGAVDRFLAGTVSAADVAHVLGATKAVMHRALTIERESAAQLDAARRQAEEGERTRREVQRLADEAQRRGAEAALAQSESERRGREIEAAAQRAQEAAGQVARLFDQLQTQWHRTEEQAADAAALLAKANETLVVVLNERRRAHFDAERARLHRNYALVLAFVLAAALLVGAWVAGKALERRPAASDDTAVTARE